MYVKNLDTNKKKLTLIRQHRASISLTNRQFKATRVGFFKVFKLLLLFQSMPQVFFNDNFLSFCHTMTENVSQLLNLVTTLKIKIFKKLKKTPGDIIILKICTINDKHMMYGS